MVGGPLLDGSELAWSKTPVTNFQSQLTIWQVRTKYPTFPTCSPAIMKLFYHC
jgi:hypothetical protein